MLNRTPPNLEGARETVHRTIRDGNRASEVIARLRALFSRKALALEPLDLNDATREVIAISQSDLASHQVTLRCDLAEGLPPVLGDRVQLQQVILNLVRNASDAMHGIDGLHRELTIRTSLEPGERVQLSVTDVGVGIPADLADKLFQPFYTTKGDGMGIGLSISRSIIESHQGSLTGTSNNGPGATFAFSLPSA
jgi:signal transduction histidine kinase